jgi:ketosteroid isomerase-like protein
MRVVLGIVAMFLPQPSHLSAQGGTAAVVERLENELNAALVGCDVASLDRLWDDELVFVFPNGGMATKAERLAGLKRCTPGSPSSSNESVKTSVYGNVAVAIVLSKWSSTAEGKPRVTRFRATHVWVERSGHWALVSAHLSQIRERSDAGSG